MLFEDGIEAWEPRVEVGRRVADCEMSTYWILSSTLVMRSFMMLTKHSTSGQQLTECYYIPVVLVGP